MRGKKRRNSKPGVLSMAIVLLSVLGLSPAVSAPAKKSDAKSYSSFWPIGQAKGLKTLNDFYVPLKTVANGGLVPRPKLAIEKGDAFLGVGNLSPGFEVPIIGAIWQPRLWSYFILRTALQTFNNGSPASQRESEWSNRLDVFVNLQLTGTEKILLGLRTLDRNNPREFSRYTFEGSNKGFNNNLTVSVEALFFEGDFGSLVPNLDNAGIEPIDYGFTIGRQSITFQEGMLINDTIDAFGIVRNNIVFPGTSNLRISAMWGWNRIDRNDTARNSNENLFGLFIAADTHVSTYNLDIIYIADKGSDDGLYIGASAIQRIRSLGNLSTAFRINSSFALEDEAPGNVIGNGTLISMELSKTVQGSNDILYFNSFVGIGNFTQAGREAIVGGPLANIGILFASPNLSTYGAELNPFTDNVVGGALGYQAFFNNQRTNLVMEVAARHDYDDDGFDQLGVGFQLQHAVGQYVQLTFEAFYSLNEDRQDGSGARAEIQVLY